MLFFSFFFSLSVCVCKTEKGTSKCQLLGTVRSCVNTCFLRRENSATVIRSLKIKYLQNSPLLLFNQEKNSDLQEHASALLIRWYVICLGCFCATLKYFFFLSIVVGSVNFHHNRFLFLIESRLHSLSLWIRQAEYEMCPSPPVYGGL